MLRESGGTTTRYLTDALGSTVALADEAGNVNSRYLYDPFGTAKVSGDDNGNARRYTGREDDGTGLHYNRARYYSPALQRFISEDPIGFKGGINLHAYAANRPTSLTDPTGFKPASAGQPGLEYFGDRDGNVWTADLSVASGKTTRARNRTIDALIKQDFPDLNFTFTARYSPWVNTGIAKPFTGTQVGWKRFGSRNDLRNTLVHEELHHRWFARGIFEEHHPRDGSGLSSKFYGTVDRYMRMRGWQ
ncbi:RHS repeat-associated core domain-containing protein [Kitasatospora aburaviensis]